MTLNSKKETFPRLGNYPQDCTKEELVEYVEELIAWCVAVENGEITV